MDDANVPSLLGLPYLNSSPDAALYARTRNFVWSERNPWFFKGSAGEGIGGPHEGADMIWPMAQIVYALTAGSGPGSDEQIRRMLSMLQGSAAGTGFMHESYNKNDVKNFTRPWFAWANSEWTLSGTACGCHARWTPNAFLRSPCNTFCHEAPTSSRGPGKNTPARPPTCRSDSTPSMPILVTETYAA